MESKLEVLTRPNEKPEGKAKVYFACHEDDFEGCFEEITGEILGKQNCAVYYYRPGTEVSHEDRLLDLMQMQLFVFPVTVKFLTEESEALMVDFSFAKENKKAILPLMQEGGLESLFNSVCGNLQFLYKYDNDPTAISYDKKLGDFLYSVLLSDEQIQKIKAAFDAYVFLSYRKKDRQYAQKIMHLIHENEFCRDVAIWYDEFLVPGEDFNENILNAIENSELFALVVTPNLDEPNYIEKEEYPAARSREKKILPLEAVETERKALEKRYENIPLCTKAEDKDELTKMLGEHLKNIALRSDSTPEHEFFIGLAYLAGIDVESDGGKAIEMIGNAAECGLKEAAYKMADIYSAGVGTDKDYIKELYWREKIASMVKAEFEEDPTPEKRTEYIAAVMKVISVCHEAGEYGNVIEKVQNACAEFEPYTLSWGEEIMMDNMKVFEAQARLKTRDFTEAEKLYRELCKKYEEKGDENFRDFAFLIISCYNNLIALCRESENCEDIVRIVERGMDLCEKAAEVFPSEALSIMASNCSNVAGVFMHLGEEYYADAKEWLENALGIETALCGGDEKRYGVDIARDYDNLGLAYMHLGDGKNAGDMFKTAKRIFDRLRQSNSELYLRDAAVNLSNLGQWYQMKKNPKEALKYYLEAIEIEEGLSCDNPEAYEIPLGRAYMSTGDAYMQMEDGDLKEARKYIEHSIEIKLNAGDRMPKSELAESYLCMGVLNHNEREWEDSMKYYDMAEEILIAMKDGNEALMETLYHDRGGWYFEKDTGLDEKAAEEHYQKGTASFDKANRILKKLIRKNPGYERRLVENYIYLKEKHAARGKRKNAIQASLSAIEYKKRILKRLGIESDEEYAKLCLDAGMMCASEKDRAGARKLLGDAKAAYVKLGSINEDFLKTAQMIDMYLSSL